MADEDIFVAAERRENPNRSQRAKQWMSSVSSMFSKCVPADTIQKMKARFNKSSQSEDGSQGMSDSLVDSDYHEFPEMNQTSSTSSQQAGFRPPSIPEKNIAVPYPSPPAEKLTSPGDDEWADNLAKRASYEIDRVREDTRRRSKTMPQASTSSPWSPSDNNYQLR